MATSSKKSTMSATAPLKLGKGMSGTGSDEGGGAKYGAGGGGSNTCMPDPPKGRAKPSRKAGKH